ncbi:MAG: ribosome small subunit-dependent GTPase A [Candidatus Moranbacteria bacterium]|nr:ribosome small subunit-dependent GTPase A [Candidatus Moranbacteria bacterium]
MNLKTLGWDLYKQFLPENIDKENIARVAVENRGSYLLYAESGELEGIIQGKFMRSAESEADYPKVGDWVLIEKLQGEDKAVIKSVLPRKTKISRKRAGEDVAEQIIAANVDIVFIVQGLDGDFNISRLERYVAMSKEGGCEPVVILNKADLIADAQAKLEEVSQKISGVRIFPVSAQNGQGVEDVRKIVQEGLSVVFVGSSGVGKSTLVNALLGMDLQKTQEVRLDDSRGRHTTTKREILLLPSGGVLIDTPGMRELGLWASQEALGETFDDIKIFAQHCKFNDCNHTQSAGCAVLKALQEGKIDRQRYDSFIKLSGSLDHFKAKKEKNSLQAQKRSKRGLIKKPEFMKK